ncbi:MAG: hypothetical protein LBE12_13255 [Planctomycetaceae bacterium]|jgi:tetratricopeptide (TPR) repeat protein|nr:hypothetical protein [Planctomycetaceae bacterium]
MKQSIIFYVLFFFFFVTGISRSAEISEGDVAFARKNYEAALELYSAARELYAARQNQKDKDNDWKRLTVQIIRCCLVRGESERAVQEYFLLCRVEPFPPLEWIPLPWFVPTGTAMGMGLREKTAENWLDPLQTQSPGLAATLLAAAILSVSLDPAKQSRGYQLLRNLEKKLETTKKAQDQESIFQHQVALLAAALCWKQRIPTLKNPTALIPLRHILDQIPEEPYRAGPLFLFGRAARMVGDHETAVLAWMRIPILYSENTLLVVEALREAALSLEKLGRFDQAERLRTELLQTELLQTKRL